MSTQEIAQLFDAYHDLMYRFVMFRVGNRDVAEDIVGSIFEKVVRSFDTYSKSGRSREITTENEELRKWIYTIARNTVIDHYRSDKTAMHVDMEEYGLDIADETPDAAHMLDITINLERVMEVLAVLPDRQKEIVLLRYQSDFTNKEISEMLGIDQRTVSSLLSRGLSSLKKELGTDSVVANAPSLI